MWRHVVVEGYCVFSREEEPYPCNRESISSFCLRNGHCPHFGYADSEEREAALWVPLHLIVWDRIKYFWEYTLNLRWNLWDRWTCKPINFSEMPCAKCTPYDMRREQAKEKFPEWLKEAEKEE